MTPTALDVCITYRHFLGYMWLSSAPDVGAYRLTSHRREGYQNVMADNAVRRSFHRTSHRQCIYTVPTDMTADNLDFLVPNLRKL